MVFATNETPTDEPQRFFVMEHYKSSLINTAREITGGENSEKEQNQDFARDLDEDLINCTQTLTRRELSLRANRFNLVESSLIAKFISESFYLEQII